ncbi:uncharacterized protein SCDLUD_000162 [Saccharomycodes ludwigii]|uniref:uncharacterized protein n=1 Tax=Saccharomycodes ludwigii TaxID=36035 RepID=UPI001E899F9A|nr:hypothetical protein SCDLUD_000162 [Saccharomycodes ludwigii]KAH3902582.1 hypothetical protein SCDLUD_000162 [Saccharomycodes ludwigii]
MHRKIQYIPFLSQTEDMEAYISQYRDMKQLPYSFQKNNSMNFKNNAAAQHNQSYNNNIHSIHHHIQENAGAITSNGPGQQPYGISFNHNGTRNAILNVNAPSVPNNGTNIKLGYDAYLVAQRSSMNSPLLSTTNSNSATVPTNTLNNIVLNSSSAASSSSSIVGPPDHMISPHQPSNLVVLNDYSGLSQHPQQVCYNHNSNNTNSGNSSNNATGNIGLPYNTANNNISMDFIQNHRVQHSINEQQNLYPYSSINIGNNSNNNGTGNMMTRTASDMAFNTNAHHNSTNLSYMGSNTQGNGYSGNNNNGSIHYPPTSEYIDNVNMATTFNNSTNNMTNFVQNSIGAVNSTNGIPTSSSPTPGMNSSSNNNNNGFFAPISTSGSSSLMGSLKIWNTDMSVWS